MTRLRRVSGFSLIELMVALVLGALLVLGLLKIFDASRASYKLSEGLARVQENGRFAMDYLQRDLRMAGHMGCLNDQTRFLSEPAGFRSAFVAQQRPSAAQLDAAPDALRFNHMIQGFEASGTAPGGSVGLPASGAWAGAPNLPGYIAALTPAPMAGSDVVAVRFFSPESVPVKAVSASSITVDSARWNQVIAANGYARPGLLAIADCQNATSFEATSVAEGGADTTIAVTVSGLNRSDLGEAPFSPGQATLHRAETMVYYVAANPQAGNEPTLYRARFTAEPGAAATTLVGGAPEPLVEGVENMQLIYGLDSQTDQARQPTGFVSRQAVASAVQPGADPLPWRRVGLVQVGLLLRSADGAGTAANLIAEKPRLLGVQTAPADDGRYRTVYESTIALRNRLFGN
ncbi:type IV pilus assembly protein PilW [Lysobacter sp. yr284]|uniref:PilW family protein n=1 Tax=Lysobacter sp. yr284 TaxID=1761791 RepID=UPI00089B41E0|nr:PilW family protein [Lysobacter sp. yr284]SDY34609.1 type IV pilus assembly protein PilW [Lysobacter sp. yr284]